MLKLFIDEHLIEVPPGTSILNAAKAYGIPIPTLCNYEFLKPYGGCRLCVVEVEGSKVLQPSCTLPVVEGMVVHTSTPKVIEAREFILSMLFSERNHFCMYCQVTGGDCELQNAALSESMTHWPIQPTWNNYKIDASHPYFIMDHNRCILCRRCVRACGELVGNYTLATSMRGADSIITADNGIPLRESTCVRCGTCVSVCPTGALIDRKSAYLGKSSETQKTESICLGCSIGCGIEVVTRDNQLHRINALWEAKVNSGLLCEDGRYKPLNEPRKRILTPMIRKNGILKNATWGEALNIIANELKPISLEKGIGLAALISTRVSTEALSLFKDLFSNKLNADIVTTNEENINHYAKLNSLNQNQVANLEDLSKADCVVVIGADVFKHHQVAGFFIKRNLDDKCNLVVIDPNVNSMDTHALFKIKSKPGTDAEIIFCLINCIQQMELDRAMIDLDSKKCDIDEVCINTQVDKNTILSVSKAIGMSESPVFIIGKGISPANHPSAQELLALLVKLAELTRGKVLLPRGQANSLAAIAYGLSKPFQPGEKIAAYIAIGDDNLSERQLRELDEIHFLAVQACFESTLTEISNVILPVETWNEQSGHFLNFEGYLQTANSSINPIQTIHSHEQVLLELADILGYELNKDWQTEILPYIRNGNDSNQPD